MRTPSEGNRTWSDPIRPLTGPGAPALPGVPGPGAVRPRRCRPWQLAARSNAAGLGGAGRAFGAARPSSGACRNASRPTQRHPRCVLIRSMTVAPICWSSSAPPPSTRRIRVAGSRPPAGSGLGPGRAPLQADRFGIGRDALPDDVGPAGDDLRLAEAIACQHRADAGLDEIGQRPGPGVFAVDIAHRACFSFDTLRPRAAHGAARLAGPGVRPGPAAAVRNDAPARRTKDRPSPSRLVRSPPARAALAGRPRRAPRSLPRLAVRGHAATDHGRCGSALLRAISRTLADRRAARRGASRAPAQGMGRARLLRPGPQPACLRPGRRRAPWRKVPGERSCPALAARHWRLHGGGGRGDRVRPPGDGRRRQCRTGRGAPVCGGGAAARRTTRDPAAGRGPRAARSARGFRPGHHGFRRDALHAARTRLHDLPGHTRTARHWPQELLARTRAGRPSEAARKNSARAR